MKFYKSNHLGVFVNDLKEAEDYYSSLFGFELISRENEKISYKNGEQLFYIIKSNKESGAIFEFEVDDIEKVITLCLRHRLRKDPLETIDSGEKVNQVFREVFEI